MKSKERIKAILAGKQADRVGFWLGNPVDETKLMYYKHFGIVEDETFNIHNENEINCSILTKKSGKADTDLALKLESDIMWFSPELDLNSWKHPEGKPMFDFFGGKSRVSLSQPGVFAECEDIKEVEAFGWPDPEYLDFTSTMENIDYARSKDLAVFGGMWMPFFHVVADFFGMGNYFVKMYTDPEVVEAVTERVVDFYLAANKKCLDDMGSKLDAAFFGNDFGTQLDLMVSPEMFRKFILPSFKKIIKQIKSYNLQVILHSCGAISRVIPLLLDAGVDVLHPLQAKALGMDAESLVKQFRGDVVFFGGVDTQELLPFGTPEQVRNEVRRLKKLFGESFIVSPSHEALLPNVCAENVIAMRDAAKE